MSTLPEEVADRLELLSTTLKGSPAEFRDKEGWFDLSLSDNGSATIKFYGPTSRLNRHTSMPESGDSTVFIPDLNLFISLLHDAYMRGCDVIDKDQEVMAQERQAEFERLHKAADFSGLPPDMRTTEEEKHLLALAAEYGLSLKNTTLEGMHDAIGEAVGLKREKKESDSDYLVRLDTRHKGLGEAAAKAVEEEASKAMVEPDEEFEEVVEEAEEVEEAEDETPSDDSAEKKGRRGKN